MASSYIHRTNSSGSGTTATVSMWVKQNQVFADGGLFQFYTDASNYVSFYCNPDVKFRTYISNSYGQGDKATKLKNRDPAAWYHYVCVFDTTNGDANDRMRLWINGVRIDAPDLNTDTDPSASYSFTPLVSGIFSLNKYAANSTYSDHVYSHVHYCDGYAYDASTFGEFDSTSGIWKIKTGPSVSYGTNGVFLKFEDRTNLDLDSSPNAHTMTTVGTVTPTYDNPSNNFCTWTPLFKKTGVTYTFSNGNLVVDSTGGSGWHQVMGTLGATAGKWYYEGYINYTPGAYNTQLGWGSSAYLAQSKSELGIGGGIDKPSFGLYDVGTLRYSTESSNEQSTGSWAASWTTGDYVMMAVDLDNGRFYVGKNGTWDATSSSNPAAGTGGYSFTVGDHIYIPMASLYYQDIITNFGNGYFGTTSSGTTEEDDAGIGQFKYEVPTGFYSICTKNIKEYG